jgi:hypothetical protein
MKSGKCPKCKSAKVYQRNFPGGYRSSLALAFESGVRLEDYICGACGYVESYMEDLKKIDKIKEHCSPVSPK